MENGKLKMENQFMSKLPDIRKIDVKGKRVLVRTDLDVPLSEVSDKSLELRKIEDDMRLVAGLPTIEHLLEKGATVIVGGHLDRPNGYDKSLSLEPVAYWFRQKFKVQSSKFKITAIEQFDGWQITNNLFLLENLRFYKGEEENDLEFSRKLASLADIYVNDAFAMSHRDHASVTGIAKLLPHYAGLRLQTEVENLSKVLDNPKRPLVVIIGGKKIETKLPLVNKMHGFADYVLVGGKICEESEVFLKMEHEKKEGKKSILLIAEQNAERTDITEKSLANFLEVIKTAETIVWNGAMGIIDQNSKIKDQKQNAEAGTRGLVEGIIKNDAFKVVGGGDTVEYLKRIHVINKFDFVSTGGGAMLSFLAGEKLPGIIALEK